jgi:hypothetical protein
MAKESVEELLKQAIAASDRTTAASDRTTRAIRAFVLFLFIQLTFTSIAAILFWIGVSIFETASIWDFQQRAWAYLLVAVATIILSVGVLVSSIMGWRELALSNVGLNDPSEEKPMIYEYQTSETQKKYPESPANSKAAPLTGSTEASEGRICHECVKYTTKVECEHCGERES